MVFIPVETFFFLIFLTFKLCTPFSHCTFSEPLYFPLGYYFIELAVSLVLLESCQCPKHTFSLKSSCLLFFLFLIFFFFFFALFLYSFLAFPFKSLLIFHFLSSLLCVRGVCVWVCMGGQASVAREKPDLYHQVAGIIPMTQGWMWKDIIWAFSYSHLPEFSICTAADIAVSHFCLLNQQTAFCKYSLFVEFLTSSYNLVSGRGWNFHPQSMHIVSVVLKKESLDFIPQRFYLPTESWKLFLDLQTYLWFLTCEYSLIHTANISECNMPSTLLVSGQHLTAWTFMEYYLKTLLFLWRERLTKMTI